MAAEEVTAEAADIAVAAATAEEATAEEVAIAVEVATVAVAPHMVVAALVVVGAPMAAVVAAAGDHMVAGEVALTKKSLNL